MRPISIKTIERLGLKSLDDAFAVSIRKWELPLKVKAKTLAKWIKNEEWGWGCQHCGLCWCFGYGSCGVKCSKCPLPQCDYRKTNSIYGQAAGKLCCWEHNDYPASDYPDVQAACKKMVDLLKKKRVKCRKKKK